MKVTLAEIVHLVKGKLIGEPEGFVSHLAPLDDIGLDALVYVQELKSLPLAENSLATALLVGPMITHSLKPLIQVDHPRKSFIHLLSYFNPVPPIRAEIHPTAIIASGVNLGKNIFIGAYVVIEAGCCIGDNCVIKNHVSIGKNVFIGARSVVHPQVTIYDNCQIGNEVIIHASTVIGSDGFGYIFCEEEHLKIPQVGKVIIHDKVEVGANSTIDRGTLSPTVIGEGTKIDNLVQIAHSVKLGKHNILCAFTGIAGSTVSGSQVTFAGKVGVGDHVVIEDKVILAGGAGVASRKHLKKGNTYFGIPARPKEKSMQLEASLVRIPFLHKQLKRLALKVEELEKRIYPKES